MKNMQVNKQLFYLLVFLGACRPSALPEDKYLNWMKDQKNGCHKVKKVGDISLEVQYKPTDFVMAEEIDGRMLSAQEYSNRKKEIDGLQYFDLRIKDNSGLIEGETGSKQEMNERLYYFSYEFENDLTLIDGNDTLPCVLYHFERTYNLKNTRNFVIGFEKKNRKEMEDKCLVIDSRALGLGIVKIKIDKEALENIPVLENKELVALK
jgi:hypothetical protein